MAKRQTMAIYTMWIVAAKRNRQGRWRADTKRKIRCIGVGVAGMMVSATFDLTAIRGARAARQLEGAGVVLTKAQLADFLRRQSADERLRREWISDLSDRKRYAVFAEET